MLLHKFLYIQCCHHHVISTQHSAAIAAIGYHLVRVDEKIDTIVLNFYEGILKGYWDLERKLIDEYYRTIPFPFKEITTPEFKMQVEWNNENLLGFLSSWSATQHFQNRNHCDPIDEIRDDVMKAWPDGESKTVSFPIFIRAGIVEK